VTFVTFPPLIQRATLWRVGTRPKFEPTIAVHLTKGECELLQGYLSGVDVIHCDDEFLVKNLYHKLSWDLKLTDK
jgi:hypothetical protein